MARIVAQHVQRPVDMVERGQVITPDGLGQPQIGQGVARRERITSPLGGVRAWIAVASATSRSPVAARCSIASRASIRARHSPGSPADASACRMVAIAYRYGPR